MEFLTNAVFLGKSIDFLDKCPYIRSMTFETQDKKPFVVLVGLQLPKVATTEFQSSLNELTRLVNTLGYQVVGQVTQKRGSTKSAQVLGDGKLKSLAQWTGGTGVIQGYVNHVKTRLQLRIEKEERLNSEPDSLETEDNNETADQNSISPNVNSPFSIDSERFEAENEVQDPDIISSNSHDNQTEFEGEPTDGESDLIPEKYLGKVGLVIVDHDLSPSQLRNLESATGVPVMDRTGVIIEIFSRHARTKRARLQVEVARLAYMAPRIRESEIGGDRQGGGIGSKGSGETKLELDKRKIRDRIKELKDEIDSLGDQDEVRRARRQSENTVALIGYTNAGKSSLMRALTGSEVLVQDKLFATLDTTIRPLIPDQIPRILISDTVGFIKKLPHDLVASFKSTLDEATHASLQLLVVDASDPTFRSQMKVTEDVLTEIQANDIDRILVLNKIDKLSLPEIESLKEEFPKAWLISTVTSESIQDVKNRIRQFFEKEMTTMTLFVEYSKQKLVYEIRKNFKVSSETTDEKGFHLTFLADPQEYQIFLNKFLSPAIKQNKNLLE